MLIMCLNIFTGKFPQDSKEHDRVQMMQDDLILGQDARTYSILVSKRNLEPLEKKKKPR